MSLTSITEWEVYITAQDCRLRNDLYCVEWDVKLYYTIPLRGDQQGCVCVYVCMYMYVCVCVQKVSDVFSLIVEEIERSHNLTADDSQKGGCVVS